MAAGESRRFGASKQLCKVNDKYLINHVIEQYHHVGLEHINVVLGANWRLIQPILPSYVSIVVNQHWQQGLGQSIACGVNAAIKLKDPPTHLLIGLADQVGITTSDLDKLVTEQTGHIQKAVASCYNNVIGVPASFPQTYWKELLSLTGDVGAKKLLSKHQETIRQVNLPDAAFDIDRPEDLAKWLKQQKQTDTSTKDKS